MPTGGACTPWYSRSCTAAAIALLLRAPRSLVVSANVVFSPTIAPKSLRCQLSSWYAAGVRFAEIDDERFEAWALLLQAHATLLGSLERELVSGYGMPLTWYEVLMRLVSRPERSLRMQH